MLPSPHVAPTRVPTITWLLATAALLSLALPASATPYHSATGHYTIDVPDGWVVIKPTLPTPANDVPVTRGGTPMIDVVLRPANTTDRFPPVVYIAVEPSYGRQTNPVYEDDNAPGSWLTKTDSERNTFKATRRVPLLRWMEHRTDARGWITPTSIGTLSLSTVGRQFDTYEPAFRHMADSFRPDNPSLLLPTMALLAVAATVIWVARRAR